MIAQGAATRNGGTSHHPEGRLAGTGQPPITGEGETPPVANAPLVIPIGFTDSRTQCRHICTSRVTSRLRKAAGPSHSSAMRAASSAVSGSSELAIASS
jgi:hypothetical protein